MIFDRLSRRQRSIHQPKSGFFDISKGNLIPTIHSITYWPCLEIRTHICKEDVFNIR